MNVVLLGAWISYCSCSILYLFCFSSFFFFLWLLFIAIFVFVSSAAASCSAWFWSVDWVLCLLWRYPPSCWSALPGKSTYDVIYLLHDTRRVILQTRGIELLRLGETPLLQTWMKYDIIIAIMIFCLLFYDCFLFCAFSCHLKQSLKVVSRVSEFSILIELEIRIKTINLKRTSFIVSAFS